MNAYHAFKRTFHVEPAGIVHLLL